MTRRARHLNPGSAGASVAIDARRLTGYSNGANLTNYKDISGGGNDYSTVSGTSPVYETNKQGGQPSVSFVSTGYMTGGPSVSLDPATVFIVGQTSTTSGRFFVGSLGSAGFGNWSSGSPKVFMYYAGAFRTSPSAGTFGVNDYVISSTQCSNAASTAFFSNGSSLGTAAAISGFVAASVQELNGFSAGSFTLDGHISAYSLFTSYIAAPLRRRLEQSYAYSFKIPCS